MKVAILGAGGALGARIVESFQLGEGPSLTAIAREAPHLAAAARFPIDLRVADEFDVSALARSFAGSSAAVHALDIPAPDRKRSVGIFCRAGAEAGLRRLVYVSTTDVYGLDPQPGTDEKTPLHTRHASDEINHLVAADRHFSAECRELGLAGTVLRPGAIYGPRSPWFARVAAGLEADRVWLARHGDGICNCVYLDHVVSAIRLVLKPKIAVGTAFILVDDETVTWRGFYEAVARELELPAQLHDFGQEEAGGDGEPPAADTVGRHGSRWKFSARLAAQTLNLKAEVPFAEGIRRSVAWWRFAHGHAAP